MDDVFVHVVCATSSRDACSGIAFCDTSLEPQLEPMSFDTPCDPLSDFCTILAHIEPPPLPRGQIITFGLAVKIIFLLV